jgi:hypothetical protein
MTVKQMILICSVIFLFSCGNKKDIPVEVLKPVKMQAVLWDILRADVFTYDFITKDSAKKPEAENIKLQQQVFLVHKTTREAFYKSYEFYKAHPSLLQPILDSIINKATSEKYLKTQTAIPKPPADTGLKAKP